MKKLTLLTLCAWALPALASKPAPSLKNQFVAFFVDQKLDKAKGAYKDMPDYQKIDALQAVFDVSDPATMDRSFQEALARFLASPINVDHNTFWKQLSVPVRWQEWIGKQRHLKTVAKPLSSAKKVRPAAPAAGKPSTTEPAASSSAPSAAYDVKGDAAAAAAAGAPEKPAAPSSRSVDLPPKVIAERIAKLSDAEPTVEYVESLDFLIRSSWKKLSEDQKAQVIQLFLRLRPLIQKALVGNLKTAHADQGAIRMLSGYLPAESKPVEKEKKRAAPPISEARSTIDALLTGNNAAAFDTVIDILKTLSFDDLDLPYGFMQISTLKFDNLSTNQKKRLAALFADMPAEFHQALLAEWQRTTPRVRTYFEAELQKYIDARKPEGR